VWNLKLDETPVDLGVKFDDIVEICDEVEEDQPEVFGPQIDIDLETGSDLGEPPVEAVREVHAVEVIGEETSEVGKLIWRWKQVVRLFIGLRVVILFLRTTQGTLLKRWEK